MKKTLKMLLIVCLVLCAVFSLTACAPSGCQDYLYALMGANSFTVVSNGEVVMEVDGDTMYYRSKSTMLTDRYDEYYMAKDKGGNRWKYYKGFTASKWKKEAMSDARYGTVFVNTKNEFGVGDDIMEIVQALAVTFDTSMTKTDGKYVLKYGKIAGVDLLEMNVSGGRLMVTLRGRAIGSYDLEFYKLNKTKVEVPKEAIDAEIG